MWTFWPIVFEWYMCKGRKDKYEIDKRERETRKRGKNKEATFKF